MGVSSMRQDWNLDGAAMDSSSSRVAARGWLPKRRLPPCQIKEVPLGFAVSFTKCQKSATPGTAPKPTPTAS